MFSAYKDKYLKINQRYQVADTTDECGYGDHPADSADPAAHVYREHKKCLDDKTYKIGNIADGCGYPPDPPDQNEKPVL